MLTIQNIKEELQGFTIDNWICNSVRDTNRDDYHIVFRDRTAFEHDINVRLNRICEPIGNEKACYKIVMIQNSVELQYGFLTLEFLKNRVNLETAIKEQFRRR